MNRIILAPIVIALLSLFPTAVPTSHGQLVGEICLADPSSTTCPTSPPVFTGTIGTQLRVAVLIQGSDSMIGFDITLLADHNILKPAAADTTGTILPGPLTILCEGVGGIAVQGSCPPTGPDTLELAVVAGSGTSPLPPPVTGLLFTAIYNITGSSTGVSIGYQTGCAESSVSGTTTCVIVANGSTTSVPETVQTATFNTSTTPTFITSASPTTVSMPVGGSGSSTISVTAVNGFTGTVSLTSTESPAGLTCTLSPASVVLGSVQTSTLTCTGTITGTFAVVVTGTSGSLNSSAALTFSVLNPDFAITASPTSVSTSAGTIGTSTITISPIGGFTGTVTLSSSATPTGLSCALTATSITLGPSQTSTLSCSGMSGAYTVTVTGTSGSTSHAATVAFIVELTGQVCLTVPGSTTCPTTPPTFTGQVGTQVKVAVFLQGSEPINGFDIVLSADHTVLKPAGIDLSGTVLPGALTILGECVGGVAVQGVCSLAAAGKADTLEVAVVGGLTANPTTGLLFTGIYNVTGTTMGTSIDYETGCSPSSVSGTTLCVQLVNGTTTLVAVTDPPATFTTNPFTVSAPSSLTIRRGSSLTTTITVTPVPGFTGTISLSTSLSPLTRKGPTATLSSSSVTITTGPATDLLTVNAPKGAALGTYTITITAISGSATSTSTITIIVSK